MNVLDVMEKATEEIPAQPHTLIIAEMLRRRRKTFRGFAELEETRGILRPSAFMASSEGQDMARLLMARGFEELTEAVTADSDPHYLEELIDAINYFWTLAILDSTSPPGLFREPLSRVLTEAAYGSVTRITPWELGELLLEAGRVWEAFRNRAWQHHAQSTYFDGWHQLAYFLAKATELVATSFPSWSEFLRFYMAKDEVLQFRLRTRY